MSPQISWIGLGNMGAGICKNFIKNGNLEKPLIVFNRNTQKAKDFSAQEGNSVAVSEITEAVTKADIIFLCLPNDKAVLGAIDTALETDVKGKILVDCSTSHPDTTAKLAELIEGKGASFVAAPIFGTASNAIDASLTFVAAGPKAAVEQIKPYTSKVIGRATIDYSDLPQRQAALLKVIGNTMIFNMTESIAEALVAAEKTGLGAEHMAPFIEARFPGAYANYTARMLAGEYHKKEPAFGVELCLKDIGYALQMTKDLGVQMRALEVAQDHLKAVHEEQGGGDVTGIYGAVRKESGLPYAN